MRSSHCGNSQKIAITCKYDAVLAEGKGNVVLVFGANQSRITCGGYADPSATKTVSNGVWYVLIEVETEHRLTLGQFCSMLIQQTWPRLRPQLIYKRLILSHLAENLIAVIVQIGKSRMDLPEREMGQAIDDFFGRPAVDFGLGKNVLHPHPRASDERPRLPIAIGAKFDMRGNGLNHVSIVIHAASRRRFFVPSVNSQLPIGVGDRDARSVRG